MRAAGFEPEDYADDDVEVWPENWPAWSMFLRMRTQWRVGMGGPTGLIYDVLMALLDRSGYAGDDWWQMFDDVCLMEAAALDALRDTT